MGKKYTRVTEKDFDNIKLLQQAGLPASATCSVTKRSYFTVAAIYKCDTLEEMRNHNADRRNKHKNNQVEPDLPPPSDNHNESTDSMVPILQNLNEGLVGIKEALVNIDNRLKFLENNIEVQSKRKFF